MRMVFVPLLQILVAQFLRPTKNGIAFGLRTCVLRPEAEGRILDDHRAFGAVEADELAAVVVQVAAQGDTEVGVVVESLDEVGKLAAIFEVVEASAGLGALGGLFRAGDEVDSGNQMDEEITAQAFAIIGVAAPAEEADGIEGALGRGAEEGVPVDGFFAGVGRNGLDPGAAGGIAVPVSVDGEDLAELAGIVNLFGFGVKDGADTLAADCDHAIGFVGGFDHGESIFDGVRHWLLAIDVFAGGAGVFEDVAMLVVHGGDEDGVDVFTIEDGTIVARGWDVGILDRFLRGGVAAVIKVAHGDALNAGDVERSLEMFASANAGADGGEAYGVAGRDGTRRGGEQVRLQDSLGDRSSGDGASADVDELTTSQGIVSHEILHFRFHCVRDSDGAGAECLRGGIMPQELAQR